jgi:hypothetical protein
MPTDQNRLRAEITIVCKEPFDDDLAIRIGRFFPTSAAEIGGSAAKTTLAVSTHTLQSAFFARDLDTEVVLYVLEDHATMKIHIERMSATSFDRLAQDLTAIEAIATDEVDRMTRFAKSNGYRINVARAIVILNGREVSKAQKKVFWQRLKDGLKTASLIGKASGVIATGLAAMSLQMEALAAGKALLTGLFAIAISSLVEAGFGDGLQFERR